MQIIKTDRRFSVRRRLRGMGSAERPGTRVCRRTEQQKTEQIGDIFDQSCPVEMYRQRRAPSAGDISFFSPKNSIRNPQAGLLTQHHRRRQSSRLVPVTYCMQLRFTAAVLSETFTPFPFHPRPKARTPADSRVFCFHVHYSIVFPLCKDRNGGCAGREGLKSGSLSVQARAG